MCILKLLFLATDTVLITLLLLPVILGPRTRLFESQSQQIAEGIGVGSAVAAYFKGTSGAGDMGGGGVRELRVKAEVSSKDLEEKIFK